MVVPTMASDHSGIVMKAVLSQGHRPAIRLWQKTLGEWKIEHWATPIYHIKANPTEQRNQELKKLLRIYLIDKEHKTWDQQIPRSLFTLYQRVNRITGYSSVELSLGHQLRQAVDWRIDA
ncbi:hypothetical protein J6590_004845 [Homalodisca vitripennis]|nr:hypothetical protein J6590_004845 [Homalodisca vitripennis]